MLRLVKITKTFAQRGTVLNDLDLAVRSGDSIAVTGPSGSGKTTLMNIIGALSRPDSGDVIFNGKSLLELNPDELAEYRTRNIGFVFQDHLLLNHLTIKENILLPLFAGKISKSLLSEKEEYSSILMKRIGIEDIGYKYPFQISGGEAQRAALVRALIRKPAVLLADEPTGSLDSKNSEIMGRLLTELNTELGITLLIATHSPALASGMSLHLRLEDGKLKV